MAPRPAQLVVAGPGAGKTEFLVRRALHLVQRAEVPPEQLLLLSFSRRSALFSRMLETTAKEHELPILRTTRQASLEENLDRALSLLGYGAR